MHPYLSNNVVWQNQTNHHRYLSTFHPDIPHAAFIGFCRGQVGSLIVPIELQARWFALIVFGKRSLPPKEDMENEIAEHNKYNGCYTSSLGGFFLANQIARHVGCEPCPVDLTFRYGIRCAYRAYFHCFAGYLYRFQGPHAKPEIALAAYEQHEGHPPFMWTIVEIASCMIGLVVYPLSKVPYLGKTKVVAPLMSVYC